MISDITHNIIYSIYDIIYYITYEITYDIICDIIYDISWYHIWCHIWCHNTAELKGLFPPAMAREIKGIATCLWSAAEERTLPLNATKGTKLTCNSTGRDQIVQWDGVQLTSRPFLSMNGKYAKLLTIVVSNPSGKLSSCWKPANNGMWSTILALNPPGLACIIGVAHVVLQ